MKNECCTQQVEVKTEPQFGLTSTLKIISLSLGLVFLFTLFHETTHIALNGFRLDSVCFLDCKPMASAGLMGNNYTPVGVYLTKPINPIAQNEDVANLSAIGLTSLVAFLAVKK